MTAPRMAWRAAGSPDRADATDTPGTCLVCGHHADRVVRAKTALGANFDYITARARWRDVVCVPCTWVLAGKPPLTFRLWSVAVTSATQLPPSMAGAPYPSDGRLHMCNRKAMGAVVDLLTAPPDDEWAVAVAQSGQKHLLPYTAVNRGRGPWVARWESTDVTSTPTDLARVLGAVAALRVAGHHTSTIAAGQPAVTALRGAGLAAWRTYGPVVRPYAGSPLLDLTIHLTTKESIHDLADRFG